MFCHPMVIGNPEFEGGSEGSTGAGSEEFKASGFGATSGWKA